MREFRFRLEKLLEIKKYGEKQKSLELAEVAGRYMKILSDIENLKAMKKRVLKERFENADNDIAVLLRAEFTVSAISCKIAGLEKDLEKTGEEREKMREKYIEALREKRVLEKLREKKESEYKKDEMARDSRVLDDLAVSGFSSVQEV